MPDFPVDRRGDWIETATGRFWPGDPRPADINVIDIAHALSHLCRFGGRTRTFYSVAQHSVLCAGMAPAHLRREALLHDAAEAYIVDVPSPVKAMLPGYRDLESRIAAAIAERFGLPPVLHERVKWIDARMLVTEAAQLGHGNAGAWWTGPGYLPPYDLIIEPWAPEEARTRFLEAFADV